jgi:hypothetical protein
MGYIAFNQTRILSSTTKKRKKERKKESTSILHDSTKINLQKQDQESNHFIYSHFQCVSGGGAS